MIKVWKGFACYALFAKALTVLKALEGVKSKLEGVKSKGWRQVEVLKKQLAPGCRPWE